MGSLSENTLQLLSLLFIEYFYLVSQILNESSKYRPFNTVKNIKLLLVCLAFSLDMVVVQKNIDMVVEVKGIIVF